uniref:Uncharacterized protein n=1 Tax=Meloidogyne hapla TaxID=6305 RepID=A0A1I8B4Z6_MELHA
MDIFTRLLVHTNKGVLHESSEIDNNLKDEYIANIKNGAYIHKYAGLWALGLDLLPTRAERILHLFVFKSCGCGINSFVCLFY